MFASFLIAATSLAFAAPGERITSAADKLVGQINASEDDAIWESFSPGMKKVLPQPKAGPFFDEVRRVGRIIRTEPVKVTDRSGTFRLVAENGNLDLQLSLDDKDRIAGLMIRPARSAGAPPGRNVTPMRLPFRDTWTVFWGGPTKEQNAHLDVPNQRRALDIVITDKEGKSHKGDGKKNTDYYCYGKELLAPAPGTVVLLIDGVPDNAPGSMNHFMATGNCVMIQHTANEFSVIAHLQPHSAKVKLGDKVQTGQVLGLCGNSGNSSEPHLHFHIQDSQVFQDGLGVTPYFQDVRVIHGSKTAKEKEYTPAKDDKLAPL